MKTWSDSKQWWMDLLKGALSMAIAVLVTLFIVNKIDTQRQIGLHKFQAEYGIKIQVIRDFEKHAKTYMLVGYDAMREYRCGKDRRSSELIRKWEDDLFDNLRISTESIQFWFGSDEHQELNDSLAKLDETRKLIWDLRTRGYIADCPESGYWAVDLHLNNVWNEYDETHFSPLRKQYYSSIDNVLSHVANLL